MDAAVWREKRAAMDALAQQLSKPGGQGEVAGSSDFAIAFFKDAPPADIIGLTTQEMAEIADVSFQAAAQRPRKSAAVFFENPPAGSVAAKSTRIIIVNDNMPFLVDTVTGALTEMGLDIQRIFHPILEIPRNAKGEFETDNEASCKPLTESIIYLEVDRRGPKTQLRIRGRLEAVLDANRAAVDDWRAMQRALSSCAAALKYSDLPISGDELTETIGFLDWLADEHFTLLGYRYYDLSGGVNAAGDQLPTRDGLGILRDENVKVWRGPDGMSDVSPELKAFLESPQPILVTKANARSLVHRTVHMDYIGVKAFADDGSVVGEHRFVGLFTSSAYARQARSIPFLRRRLKAVTDRAGFAPRSHAGKALVHVLESFPRDELFQIDEESLFEMALGILSLNQRPRTRIFARPDPFGRFVSVFAFIPREQYDGTLRARLAKLLEETFGGTVSVFYVQLGTDTLTRIQFIIRTEAGSQRDFDIDALNIAAADLVKGWAVRFQEALMARHGTAKGRILFYSNRDSFDASYRADFAPNEAVVDLNEIIALSKNPELGRSFRIYRTDDEQPAQAHLKIYRLNEILPLSDCLPMLENLGLRVISEASYDIAIDDTHEAWVHCFLIERAARDSANQPCTIDIKHAAEPLTWTLQYISDGHIENDAFNALILDAGLKPDMVNVLRGYGRYAHQLDLPFNTDYLAGCLARNGAIASDLAHMFTARFDPAFKGDRAAAQTRIAKAIEDKLEAVTAQDDDRILRMFRNAIASTVRTNAYQRAPGGVPHEILSLKLRTREIEEAPQPAPHAEIFVFGPRVEGVHLRGGPVARGGLRWTDRPEDYRTEVLGLLKAQIVKNSVIVPVGAKGGFLPRQLPIGGSRQEVFEEGRAAYQVFIRALIGLTDNLVDGAIVPPENVVRHDGDDPYLVVAADKGTATFSDTANAIAQETGFWLGDAFASGGSNGYDHKKMGITARGAWVSVQRHFREIGVNTQTDPISVVGVGDMSGDVFGNGMLLSQTIRLLAAFDHRNIFIDPDPDPARSFAERQRLFDLPRSSWMDYDTALLSKGGQIYDRNAKKLTLTPQIQALFDIEDSIVRPQDLMRAILRARADLLWFGGIGTYVKAAVESDAAAGDKANDAVRINAEDLRVKVVGEGANLGITMAARRAYADRGGRLNADFIDNSAGVDCSDNEVNLKIALSGAVKSGALTSARRDALLESMTDDVADLVLRDNYLQTQAISLSAIGSARTLEAQARLIRRLEREGRSDRVRDGLPTEDQIDDRLAKGQGLTRPELSTLLCQAKIAIFDALVESEVIDDPALEDDLMLAFPQTIQSEFPDSIISHRLRREIIATKLANALVNRGGLTIAFDLDDVSGCGLANVAAGFAAVRKIFDLRTMWRGIDSLDYAVTADVQTQLHSDVATGMRRQIARLLDHMSCARGNCLRVSDALARFESHTQQYLSLGAHAFSGLAQTSFEERLRNYKADHVPQTLAEQLASFSLATPALTIVGAALTAGVSIETAAATYYPLAQGIGAEWLHHSLLRLSPQDSWEDRALAAIRADLADEMERLLVVVLEEVKSKTGKEAGGDSAPGAHVQVWLNEHDRQIAPIRAIVQDLAGAGPLSVGKLGFAMRILAKQVEPFVDPA